MNNHSLTVTKNYKVSAETIYDAWLDPEMIKLFMKPAEVVTVPTPELEARVGGAFSFDMHVGEKVLPHKGEYKVLNRASEIQFTWNSSNTKEEDSLVTITIKSLNDNECELTLVHELLPTDASKEDHKGGWTNILNELNKVT